MSLNCEPRVWSCGWSEKSRRCVRLDCHKAGPCEGFVDPRSVTCSEKGAAAPGLVAALDLALHALKVADDAEKGEPDPQTGWRSAEYCDAYGRLFNLNCALDPLTGSEDERSAGIAQFEVDATALSLRTHQEEIERLRAENERLRELVKRAYHEGFSEGVDELQTRRGGKRWEESNARTALDKLSD